MKLFKKFTTTFLVIALMMSLVIPVQIFASESEVQQQQMEDESRIAAGALNFKGSTKNSVILHGTGFDTGDVSTINGSVKIKVGNKLKSYTFSGTVPGLYNKDFGNWYLPGWNTATLEYYYINYSDGSKSDKIVPNGITIDNDFKEC